MNSNGLPFPKRTTGLSLFLISENITILMYNYNNVQNTYGDNDIVGNALCPMGCKSIIDTGTYLIYGPSDQLQTFLADMTLESCRDKHKLPNLGFIFKGVQQNGKDSAFELILTPDDYVLEFEVDGKSDCVVGVGADNEDSGWTLGQVFLKAYYTVFDRESESVGFVKSNPNPFNPPSFDKKTNNLEKTKIINGTIKDISGELSIDDPVDRKFLSLIKNSN
jgi:hypothetical protein